MKKLMSGLVIVVVIMLGGYYFMGWGTERVLKDNLAVMNRTHANTVELKAYHRGWFTSHALIKWVVKVPEPTTLRIPHSLLIPDRVYVSEVSLCIVHGPIMWVDHGLKFGLGYIKSRVLIPTIYNRKYNSVFDKSHSVKPVLKITALVNYLTNTTLQLQIPAFSLATNDSANQFKWLGMTTNVNLSSDKKHIAGHLDVGGFSWIEEDMRGVIGAVKSDYDMRRNIENVYFGNAHLQIASGTLIKGGQQLAQVADADFTSENNIQDGLFNSRITMSVKNLAVNQLRIGESRADLAVARLDAKTLEEMNRKIAQSQSHTEEDKHRTLLALVPDVPMLLAKGAQITIHNLELAFPNGRLKASVNIAFPDQPVYNPLQMMQKLTGNGRIRLTKSLVNNWLQGVIKAKLQHAVAGLAVDGQNNSESTPTSDIDARVSIKLAEKLSYLTVAGILVSDGDDFVMALKLENGRLMVNDHMFSPEMFAI